MNFQEGKSPEVGPSLQCLFTLNLFLYILTVTLYLLECFQYQEAQYLMREFILIPPIFFFLILNRGQPTEIWESVSLIAL